MAATGDDSSSGVQGYRPDPIGVLQRVEILTGDGIPQAYGSIVTATSEDVAGLAKGNRPDSTGMSL